MTDSHMVVSVGHSNLIMTLPGQVWKVSNTDECPLCKSKSCGETEVSSCMGEFNAIRYDCGAVFSYSSVLGGYVVIMYRESEFCKIGKNEPEDSI